MIFVRHVCFNQKLCVHVPKKNPFERVQSTNRRMTTPCPQSRRFLSRTAYASDQQGSCEWGPSTSPGYQYSAKSFNFSMAMFNELGNKTQYLGLVDNYAIGKCPEEGTLLIFFFPYISWLSFLQLSLFSRDKSYFTFFLFYLRQIFLHCICVQTIWPVWVGVVAFEFSIVFFSPFWTNQLHDGFVYFPPIVYLFLPPPPYVGDGFGIYRDNIGMVNNNIA